MTIYEVLQELWGKAIDSTTSWQPSDFKRNALDDAAVKINDIIKGKRNRLPPIPRGKGITRKNVPYFTRFDNDGQGPWYVIGFDKDLEVGAAVEINKHNGDRECVVIREHEYERVVNEGKDNEYRYVMATFHRDEGED